MPLYVKIIIIAVCSYFIGNINFAIIISRFKHGDIRKSGSGNPGTMNVVRSYGKIIGALCLILDAFKAAIPAFFSWWLVSGVPFDVTNKLGLYVCGLSIVIGHIYPVFMKFKGGKGIACILGIALLAQPIVTIITFAVGLLFILFFKIGALGSFLMILTPNIYELIMLGGNDLAVSALIFVIIALATFAHRSNIVRMFTGRENRTVFFPKKKKSESKPEITKEEL